MKQITLGKTGITVPQNAFGALPIQRISTEDAVGLLRKAYEGGMRFFDTARAYTDSEEKLGLAFCHIRDRLIISTKTAGRDVAAFWKDLEQSLRMLKTDHIDIYQFHNPPLFPHPEDGTGLYEAMLEARRQGKIRFIGFTNHRRNLVEEAIRSGLYDTIQYPLSYLSGELDVAVAEDCRKHDLGFIAMKALAGGLINDAATAYAYMAQFSNVVPIWGIQRERELDEFLACMRNPPDLTTERMAKIEADRKELSGEFCRGCGYCQPCPAGIEIQNCARMSLMLRRAVKELYLTPEWQAKMAKITECRHCGLCKSRCPYQLDTPELLRRNYIDYQTFIKN